jgi:tRNA dimethylallyltransferase
MGKKIRKIIVIVGPTSSGKSDLAVELARKYSGEIISADSRQVYRDMNLGTGKVEGRWKEISNFRFPISNKISNDKFQIFKKQPYSAGSLFGKKGTDKEVFVYKNIPHYLIDFVSPKKEYNISYFKNDCEKLIKKISNKGKTPIICGGTGFWIKAVVYDQVLPAVKPDQFLRNKLISKTAEELFQNLRKIDSERAKNIDRKNKIRLIRAIEIADKLGKVPEIKKGNFKTVEKDGVKIVRLKKNNEIWEFLQLGISFSKEELSERIEERLRLRFKAGMTEEVDKLKKKYNLDWKKIQSFGLAYFWIPKFLKKEINEAELRRRIFLAEKQYAKRQMTWFKKDEGINWVNKENKIVIEIAENFLKDRTNKTK